MAQRKQKGFYDFAWIIAVFFDDRRVRLAEKCSARRLIVANSLAK